jgi:hypothetical protein
VHARLGRQGKGVRSWPKTTLPLRRDCCAIVGHLKLEFLVQGKQCRNPIGKIKKARIKFQPFPALKPIKPIVNIQFMNIT